MKILELTCHYFPNMGGVETHLLDLVNVLNKRNYEVFVLTYQPLTTKASWGIYEHKNNLSVFRIPWIRGLFYKLIKYPFLEFLYLLPGLIVLTPIVLIFSNSDVIHAHGLVTGVAATFWGKLFGKRVVITIHSMYNFPKSGLYRQFVKLLFNKADYILSLSKQAADEVISLGVSANKVKVFTYWIDLDKFHKIEDAKNELHWRNTFTVLFVGRLVFEKGIRQLLEAAKGWDKKITLAIVGTGPLESEIVEFSRKYTSINFLGLVDQERLPLYYNAADLVIVPSVHEEGFGRVILEALACGTPVVAANRGAIPEAMDESVGKLIKITPQNIVKAVNYLYKNKSKLGELSKNTRAFAKQRYSEKNIEVVLKCLNK